MSPIPAFDHNLVIPPHLGNPTDFGHLSPYKCTTIDLCNRFSTSPERITILKRLLNFRSILVAHGLINGFQWIDGSFLEDVETRENRPPNDMDIVTIYWGYDKNFQSELVNKFPEFSDNLLSKNKFSLDHYPFDAGHSPLTTVEYSRYWIQLFSHNRNSVWKGMLQVALNTPSEDDQALQYLNSI